MKNQDLAVVGVRLLGLFILFQTAQQLAWGIGVIERRSSDSFIPVLATFAPPLILGCLALAILMAAPRIAAWISPDREAVSQADSQGLQAMILATIGIFLIVRSIPGLVGQIAGMLLPREDLPSSAIPYPIGYLFSGMIQLLLGVFLLFSADGLAGWWHRARAPRYDLEA